MMQRHIVVWMPCYFEARLQFDPIQKMHGAQKIIAPHALDGENPEAHTPAQEVIITALARVFAWSELLERGEVASISEFAHRLDRAPSYIGRIFRPTTLTPDITEAILQHGEPDGLSLAKLTKTLPEDWTEQHATLFTSSPSRPEQ